jgi:hypothetical protein
MDGRFMFSFASFFLLIFFGAPVDHSAARTSTVSVLDADTMTAERVCAGRCYRRLSEGGLHAVCEAAAHELECGLSDAAEGPATSRGGQLLGGGGRYARCCWRRARAAARRGARGGSGRGASWCRPPAHALVWPWNSYGI